MTQSSQCLLCQHYEFGKTCAAFPRAIPQQIFVGGFDHRKPYPGDNGIRFRPLNRDAVQVVAEEDADDSE